MNKRTCLLLLSGIITASSPFYSFSTSKTWAGTASASTQSIQTQQVEMETMLKAAFQEFLSEKGLTEQTMANIRQKKDIFFPYLQKGLAFTQIRYVPYEISSFDSSYREFQFWLETGSRLQDRRVEQLLLAWLSEKRPIPDRYALTEKIKQMIPAGKEDIVKERMDQATSEGMAILLTILKDRGKLNEKELDGLAKRFADKPQMAGIVEVADNPQWLKQLYRSASLPIQLQRHIAERLLSFNDQKWMQETAKSTTDIYTEQLIDAQLVRNHGDKAAAARLYNNGLKNGIAVTMDGMTEKFLADLYPTGELSKGIRDYQQIRGTNYFYHFDGSDWYSYESNGKDYRQPHQAIPQWLSFIKKYPKHPAADDAAYRLARCYQQTGQFEEALYWFDRVKQLGDHDLTYDTSGQFLYVLDVELGADRMSKLDSSHLPAWSKPWIEYTQAVEQLRERQYDLASQSLQRFIERYQGQNLFEPADVKHDAEHYWQTDVMDGQPFNNSYPFWQEVQEQLTLAKQLAAKEEQIKQAAGTEKTKKEYELAALIYRNSFLYYNHLWRGERQTFFWFGQIKYMDYNEPLDRYIGRFNHLAQAIHAFKQIDLEQSDEETGAKTLYSLALSHSKLIQYGEEVRFHASKTELSKQIILICERLVKQYPNSELADDALLLAYHYSKESKYLQQLVTQYPQGDQANQAQDLLQKKEKPQEYAEKPQHASLPIQTLTLEDWRLPTAIKEWVKKEQGNDFRGYKRDGDWFYVYVTAPKGKQVWLTVETDAEATSIGLAFNEWKAPRNGQDTPDRLIRLPYRFIEENKIDWKVF